MCHRQSGGRRSKGAWSLEIRTELDKARGLRVHLVRGRVTYEELVRALEEIYSAPWFDPDMNSLWDLREARFDSASRPAVEEVVRLVIGNLGSVRRGKVACVISGEFEEGLVRLFKAVVETRTTNRVGLFRDREAALRWVLGQETEEAEAA